MIRVKKPMMTYRKIQGLTLIEGVTTLALIAILIIIAIPTYYSYARRNYFSQIIALTFPYKSAVEKCYQNTGMLENCNASTNGIPPMINSNSATNLIELLTVTRGRITVVPLAKNGVTAKDNYILTPVIRRNKIFWATAGGSVENGYAN